MSNQNITKMCDKACSPSDYYYGGKCHHNGCYKPLVAVVCELWEDFEIWQACEGVKGVVYFHVSRPFQADNHEFDRIVYADNWEKVRLSKPLKLKSCQI